MLCERTLNNGLLRACAYLRGTEGWLKTRLRTVKAIIHDPFTQHSPHSSILMGNRMARDNDYVKLARSTVSEGGLRMSHRFFAATAAALTACVTLCAQIPASGQT